jgi:YspA, cpYpsA-related SLOG family
VIRAKNISRNRQTSMQKENDMVFLAVTGGRYYSDSVKVFKTLEEYGTKNLTLVLGDAPGADALALQWAVYNKIPYIRHIADWTQFGKAAGPIRNKKMIEQANLLLAFPGGRGTENCIKQAKEAGISVRRIT